MTANSSPPLVPLKEEVCASKARGQRQPRGPDGSFGFLNREHARRIHGKEDLKLIIERRKKEEAEKHKQNNSGARKKDRLSPRNSRNGGGSRPGSQPSSRNSSRCSSRDTSPSRWPLGTLLSHSDSETARMLKDKLSLIDEHSTFEPLANSPLPIHRKSGNAPPELLHGTLKRDSSESGGSTGDLHHERLKDFPAGSQY
eukprot:c12708_g1_i1.p2 GENE.c12708_g1_i1~~c12708_g1_i1.p2  ORF type:complete len:199 (+),score=19.71 c12708_g1_i1:228-824(+)